MGECFQTNTNIGFELFQFKKNYERAQTIPVVYNENYNVGFYGAENLHPFDTKKWGTIHSTFMNYLTNKSTNLTTITPIRPVSNEELGLVHTDRFIKHLNNDKSAIADAAEVWAFRLVPLYFLVSKVITPMKWQVAGSVLAAKQALEHGASVNIGGGFHHASTHKAEGFCFFADITLIMQIIWQLNASYKFMILDLDAHQGNGYERDVLGMEEAQKQQVYIMDMYNAEIWPKDKIAKKIINKKVEIDSMTDNEGYLTLLKINLEEALCEFQPSLLIYNAGSDCLIGDKLGKLNVTPEGLKQRDEIVFTYAKQRKIPIVMLTSGGYQKSNALVISESIINLFNRNLIECNEPITAKI